MRERQHFEIDQFIGNIGEGGDAVFRQIKNLEILHISELFISHFLKRGKRFTERDSQLLETE